MSPTEVTETVEELARSVRDGLPYASAVALGELVEAETAGLVSTEDWRDAVDADSAERFVRDELPEVEARYAADRDYLGRLLGQPLLFEEALLLLTLRSSLQSTSRFVAVANSLSELDSELSATLRANSESVTSARRRPTLGLTPHLPAHWWWRADDPPQARGRHGP